MQNVKSLKDHVHALHKLIIDGETIKAMELFYDEAVCMQENNGTKRCGKKINIQNENDNLKKVQCFSAKLISAAINEDSGIVFSEWEIQYTDLNDITFLLEQVSVQHWREDKIYFERFYYKESRFLNRS